MKLQNHPSPQNSINVNCALYDTRCNVKNLTHLFVLLKINDKNVLRTEHLIVDMELNIITH